MESVQNIKKRIKSVGNIEKITKAMELVAATKMRKAQEIALASRPYAFTALDLLANLSLLKEDLPKLLKNNNGSKKRGGEGKTLFVLVTSDKGLAGAFNSSVIRKFEQHVERDKEKYKNEEKLFVSIGEKAFGYLSRKGFNVLKKFNQISDYATPNQIKPISNFIIDGFLENKFDRVITVSTNFKSALKQEPHIRKILPINFDQIQKTLQEIAPISGKFSQLEEGLYNKVNLSNKDIKNYLIEPSSKIVLENLTKHLFFMQIYHLILEANASEHSARRMAMKTASDNASDLSEKLVLQYNKSRQAGITNQIIEIVSGAESLS